MAPLDHPAELEFISEIWECERKLVSEVVYDQDSEADLLDREAPIIKD